MATDHFRRTSGRLCLSSLGLGTYLGPANSTTDEAVSHAVTACLTSGRINVIDTAINYRLQRAERSVGRALRGLFESGAIARENVFVATKVGYLAPDSESRLPASQWVQQELLDPGILHPDEIVGGSHSLAPRYLVDQIERSRRNLGLACLDLLYLHNVAEAQLRHLGRQQMLRALRDAFRVLEDQRSRGAIAAYGLATWDSLRRPPGDAAGLSIQESLNVAREVGGAQHGFRFLQFPFNLEMPEACTVRGQEVEGESLTTFEASRRLALSCFTSVPLLQGKLTGRGRTTAGLTAAQTSLQFARSAPGNLSALVGQKSAAHLSENLTVAEISPWEFSEFSKLLPG